MLYANLKVPRMTFLLCSKHLGLWLDFKRVRLTLWWLIKAWILIKLFIPKAHAHKGLINDAPFFLRPEGLIGVGGVWVEKIKISKYLPMATNEFVYSPVLD